MYDFFAPLLNFFRQQTGLKTDAASSSGSVHAKLKYLNDTTVPAVTTNVNAVVNTRQKPRGLVKGSGSTASTSYVAVLNITAKGSLNYATIDNSGSAATTYMKITIDGTMVLETSEEGTTEHFITPYGDSATAPGALNWEFKTSLKIECRVSSGTGYYTYQYSAE